MRAKRVDDNQQEIVKQIRRLGITVLHLHTIGKGCPDLLLGFKNKNFLIELKDSKKTTSRKKLTDDETIFFNTWRGQVNKCETLDDILKVVNKQT